MTRVSAHNPGGNRGTSEHPFRSASDRTKGALRSLVGVAESAPLQRPRRRPGNSTLRFANNVKVQTLDFLESLDFWEIQVSQIGASAPSAAVDSAVEGVLETITQLSKETARKLTHRLSLRRFRGDALFHNGERREDEATITSQLSQMLTEIGNLNLTVALFRPITQQDESQSYKENLVETFTRYIGSLTDAERRDLDLTDAPIWDSIERKAELQPHIDDPQDPGDGKIYADTDIDKARNALTNFRRAWKTEFRNQAYEMAVEKLPQMSKICLVLRNIGRERFLRSFLGQGVEDENLPITDRAVLEGIFGKTECADIFAAEQYRAVRRNWPEDETPDLPTTEPLPFKLIGQYGRGTYGLVSEVRDVFTGDTYAHKTQYIPTPEAEAHFRQEIEIFRQLNGHRHIVKLFMSYRRNGRFGLLESNGKNSLRELLKKVYENKVVHTLGISAREWLTPELIRAFGCLASGLVYVHFKRVRHKDVKPENILHTPPPQAKGDGTFCYIDFGIAYDFSNLTSSKTSNLSNYTPQYAAPEMISPNSKYKLSAQTSVPGSQHDKVSEITPADLVNDNELHGRPADIFSLGIVYMEMLSVLMEEKDYMAKEPIASTFRGCAINGVFCNSAQRLREWADAQISKLRARDVKDSLAILIPVFEICKEMIREDPDERPKIGKVVEHLKSSEHRHRFFCKPCLDESPSITIAPQSQSPPPHSRTSARQSGTRRLSQGVLTS